MFDLLNKFLVYVIISILCGVAWSFVSYIITYLIFKNEDVSNSLEKNFVVYWITNSTIIFCCLIYISHNYILK